MSLKSNSSVKWPKSGASFQSQQLAYSDRQQLAMKGGGKSHSWWWDSHISPKNSKWLEDNLSEMDSKVKAMLRLIEEDADSFAKRAEMYYKKRPELTALVEEFYRAYRALAERYDQLTGDIRQNVPNMQAQFGLTGDSAPASPKKSKGPKRAAGFSVFLSPGTPTRSKEKYDKDNNGGSSSSSDSELDSNSQREGEEIQQLLMEIEQLKENLSKSELDQNSLQTQLNELQEELNLLHKEKSRIHEEKSNLQNEVFSGAEQVRTLKEEVKHFQEAIEKSEVDKEKGIALRILLEKNLEELRMQLSTLQDEKRKLSDDVLRGCDQVRGLEEQGTELNRLIDTMKSEQAAADANRRKLESDIDMLMKQKASLADERLLNFDQIKRLEEEQQDMLSSSEERERHVLELEQQLQKLGQDLLYSKQEHASHVELSETWKGKNNELKVELSRLEENNSKLVSELSSKTELILRLDIDVKRLQDVVVAVQDENAKSSSDLQIALTHASTVEKKCLQQEEMLVQLQEHRDKLSVEFAEMCRQRQEIWDIKSVLLVEKSELDVQVKELHSRNSRLQEEIQQIRNSNEDLSRRIQRGIEENQALETNIQGLTEQLSSSKLNEEEKINALMMEISELKIEISRLKLELSRCSAELKSLEEQREVWTLEKSRFQGDIDQLNEEKRGFQSSLVEWTEHKLKLELNHQTLEKRSREVENNLVFHQAENSRIQSEISVKTEKVIMLEQELIKMQEALSASQEEIQTLSSNMEKEKQVLEGRFEAEVDKLRVMEESIQKLQVALLSAQKKTETVTDACKVHVKEFEMREASLVSQISNLDNEIRRLDEESKELIKRLQNKSLQQEELERESLKLQQSFSSAQQEREIVEADRDRQMHELVQERETRIRAEEVCGNLKIEFKDLQVEINHLQQSLTSAQQEREIMEADRDGQMQELVQEREIRIRVEEACGKLNIEAKDLHVEINHLQVELQRLRNENQELKQHSEISTKQQQKVELDIEKLLLALQNAHENESFPIDEYKWHTGELLPKRLSLRNVEEKIFFLLAQRENRKRDHVAHTGRLKDLEGELKRRTHLYEVLREDYDALAAKHENVSKQFQVLQSQIPQLEQKIIFLEEENKKLREELLMKVKLFDETLSVLEREKMELHEKLQIEKEMLSAEVLREKVQEKETQKLHQQLEEAEANIKTLIESSSSLSHKHEMAVNELQALQLKFADLNDENVRLGREVLSRSVSITELQELVSGIEKRKAEMETEAKSREEHFIVFEEKVRTLQDENDQLDQKLKFGTEELRIVNEELLRLRQLHLDFQNENDSLKVDKQRSFDESSLLVMKFESLQKDLFDQQTMNTHLETELKKGEARIEELEGEIVKYQNEKQALTVEIASSAVTMNSLQTELDSLEEEVKLLRNELKIGGEQLLQKNEEIENVNSSLEGLRGENLGLNEELKKKILAYGRVESALNALEEERVSLQNINKKLSEAVASGVGVIDSLKKEVEQLLSEKYVLDQQVVEMTDQIQMLQKRCLMLQQTEQQLRDMVEVKEEEIRKLEEEVRKLNFTSFSVTQEKEKVAAELRLGIHRYVALENLFKSLQQDLIERSEQKSKANAVSSFMEKLTREVVELKERLGHLQDGLSSKQGEIDGIQRKNDELYDGVRERDDEVRNLREQLQVVREEQSSVQDELSTKVWFLHEIELTFKSLRETKVIFEGGRSVEIGEANLVQEEVTKLIQKVTKLSEVVRTSEEKMERLETTVHKLRIGNVNLKEDVLRLGEKEKSYVIAVRFMRAEFFCLVQRVRELKEEKEAALINLQRELDFLREEVKRQRAVIMDRGEEKRQAIRQLCLALEFSQEKTVRLEQMIRSLRLVVHDRPGRGGCCACCLPV